VTDGGHYENLGLVELLRRGCMLIYCFDASGGKGMSALGDALALARGELGVEIEFTREDLEGLREKGDERLAESCCVVGKIRYARSNVEEVGKLVYAPSVMTAGLPWGRPRLQGERRCIPASRSTSCSPTRSSRRIASLDAIQGFGRWRPWTQQIEVSCTREVPESSPIRRLRRSPFSRWM
jgi:hypothetical protein